MAVIGAHRVRGELLAEPGNVAEARASYERTFALSHEHREHSASPDARTAMMRHEQAAFRGYLDLVMSNRDGARRGQTRPRRARGRRDAQARARARRKPRRRAHRRARCGDDRARGCVARADGRQEPRISAHAKRELSKPEAASSKPCSADVQSACGARSRAHGGRDQARGRREIPAERGARLARARARSRAAFVCARQRARVRLVAQRVRHSCPVLAMTPRPRTRVIALGALDRQTAPREGGAALERVSGVLLPADLLPADSTAIEIVAGGPHRRRAVRRHCVRPRIRAAARRNARAHDDHVDVRARRAAAPNARAPFRLVALASGSGTLRSAAVPDPRRASGRDNRRSAPSPICSSRATGPRRSNYCSAPTAAPRRCAASGAAAPTSSISRRTRSRICASRWRRCSCCRRPTPPARPPISPRGRSQAGAATRTSCS